MGTALDMAKRLKQESLRKIAVEVALLTHTAVPRPLSLGEILKLFASVAKPEAPTHLEVSASLFDGTTQVGPYFVNASWRDGGEGSFRYANRYHFKLRYYTDGNPTDAWDQWTTYGGLPGSPALYYDTDYKASVLASNEWGLSEWSWAKFSTGSDPNAHSPGPGPAPAPQPQPKPSGILFWNCDASVNPSSVYFWLFDLTAGTPGLNWLVASGYSGGSCGPGFTGAQLTIPSPSTTSLVAGHEYRWMVVSPDRPGCDGNDPTNSACVAASDTFTAGNDVALSLPWSNT